MGILCVARYWALDVRNYNTSHTQLACWYPIHSSDREKGYIGMAKISNQRSSAVWNNTFKTHLVRIGLYFCFLAIYHRHPQRPSITTVVDSDALEKVSKMLNAQLGCTAGFKSPSTSTLDVFSQYWQKWNRLSWIFANDYH